MRQALHQHIDTPCTYRLEQLPRALPWKQIVALLRSIDCSSRGGLRDFALLYLAARSGLRSGELVRLTLDDLDWRAGTLKIVQRKTQQEMLLPLTDEAGIVLARYLKMGRPPSRRRELSLRCRAPAGRLAPNAVHDIFEHRSSLRGLKLPPKGSRVLRHSLAVHLLHRGVCLPAIGATLGHRDSESTAVYLRLATAALRQVGLPVPTGGKNVALRSPGWKVKLVRVRQVARARRAKVGWRSRMAPSLCDYLQPRRALGRAYVGEERILQDWDDFLARRYAKMRAVTANMFWNWVQTMPVVTSVVRRNRMRIVRNFLLFDARQHPRTCIPDVLTFPSPSPHRCPRLVSPQEMAQILATATLLPPSH
ncbi:MAG: tyrosine-type recombinase/integrase [Pirellulaceae bacterium]|nr:tyrosine-type recombinase/integrase [Pirellulaceae bacterium]